MHYTHSRCMELVDLLLLLQALASRIRSTVGGVSVCIHPRTSAGRPAEQPGWKVLQDGYTGLEEQSKLKDLDRAAAPVEDVHGELQDVEASDEDYADW